MGARRVQVPGEVRSPRDTGHCSFRILGSFAAMKSESPELSAPLPLSSAATKRKPKSIILAVQPCPLAITGLTFSILVYGLRRNPF